MLLAFSAFSRSGNGSFHGVPVCADATMDQTIRASLHAETAMDSVIQMEDSWCTWFQAIPLNWAGSGIIGK
jgi:hypothetical protein